MSRRHLVLLSVLALSLAGCGGDKDLRKPTELKDIINPSLKPAELWDSSAGDGSDLQYTGLRMSVADNVLYAADIAGDVYAFDAKSGKRLWRSETGLRIAAGPGVVGNRLTLGTLDGEVVALNRAGGKELWRATLSSEVQAVPTGNANIIIAKTIDGRVYGLSVDKGERQWVFDRNVPNLTLRGLSDPLLADDRAYIGMDNGRLSAVHLNDGSAIWEQGVSFGTGRTEVERLTDIDADLLLNDGLIYAVSFGGELACLDAESGQVLWRRSVRSYTGMALFDNRLVVSDESGVVWAFDAKTGTTAWKQEGLLYRKLSPPAIFGGRVVVGDFEGYLHWLDLKTGAIVARLHPASDPIRAPLLVSGELLYAMDADGGIHAIQFRP